jgi:hypothetical protein
MAILRKVDESIREPEKLTKSFWGKDVVKKTQTRADLLLHQRKNQQG